MMDFTAYISLFLILYTYLGYFFVILVLGQLRNLKVAKSNDFDSLPSVTLMIAAYNEEKNIHEKILNSLKLDYPKELLEILVVSDASSDDTDIITKSFADQGVKLIRIEGRLGKTEARNQAIKLVKSDITLFSDATTDYNSNVIKSLVSNFNDPKVGMAIGHLKYSNSSNTQMGVGQKLYWEYETLIKQAQTKFGTLTGSIGCITAFRTKHYTALPSNIIEDFTEPLMFIQKGLRVVFEKDAVCYEDATDKSSNEWSMRVRVIRGGITGLIYAKSVLNPFKNPAASFQLISHKVLRWLVPIFGIILLISSSISVVCNDSTSDLIKIIFGLQLIFYTTSLVSFILEKLKIQNELLAIPLYFAVVNLASLVAIFKVITSKLEATWETDR
jgi:cellulose synthase/poly-beta-1,6-N-acetylglucosamine synthase-like glycosyltransferase